MRYQNWDVLVFPDQSKIPLQEFKTSCCVVKDPEIQSLHSNTPLLPTVTCFIPSLPAGDRFRISVHSWENPEMSRHTLGLKRSSDSIAFEARLFIDGKMAGSKWFNSIGPWPTVIDLSIDVDKLGEFEKLKFPVFHDAILTQSFWSPGDSLGRVSVIIAEGFSRDNLAYPFERIRNIVAFSFQHAPLDVLETSSIAWPNTSMWRQISVVGPYYSQASSPRHANDGIEGHSHSPRHVLTKTIWPTHTGSMLPSKASAYTRQVSHDPFTGPVNAAFKGWLHSSTDLAMPDYPSSNMHTRTTSSRNISDSMHLIDRRDETMSIDGAYEKLCERLLPSVPVNTPNLELDMLHPAADMPIDIRDRAPAMELESIATQREIPIRKVSQPLSTQCNSLKRPRAVTPASAEVIDIEDESRVSPSLRQVSRSSIKQEGKENERMVLGTIENI